MAVFLASHWPARPSDRFSVAYLPQPPTYKIRCSYSALTLGEGYPHLRGCWCLAYSTRPSWTAYGLVFLGPCRPFTCDWRYLVRVVILPHGEHSWGSRSLCVPAFSKLLATDSMGTVPGLVFLATVDTLCQGGLRVFSDIMVSNAVATQYL